MVSFERLTVLRDYAAEVAGLAAAIPVEPGLATARDELVALARAAVAEADAPLRAGLMGEISAGKSLLLGVVLGRPDLLPTSPNPTTGNVTEIRLHPDDSGIRPTAIERARVRFFTAQQAQDLERVLLDELQQVASAGKTDAALARDLPGAREAGGDAVRQWCAAAWRDSRDPKLHKLIRAWVHTRSATDLNAGQLGTEQEVPVAALDAALRINSRMLSETFPSLDDLRPTHGDGGGLTADEIVARDRIATAFPAVERVVIDVVVPSRHWDLRAMTGRHEFVLLDFPGIGSGGSRARDLYLTQRGLRDVHTALVLVDAEKPGGSAPDEFYGFLRELGRTDQQLSELVLYCAGRFDRLPPPDVDLPADVRLTEDLLVNLPSVAPLRALLESGHRPGTHAMRAFVSSVVAIDAEGLGPAPAELALPHKIGAARATAAGWGRIADALAAGGTGRELAEALSEFARNGGVDRVRTLLLQHLRQHGLRHRLLVLDELLDEIDRRKDDLAEQLRERGGPFDAATSDRRTRAQRLMTDLDSYRGCFLRELSQLRDPAQLRRNSRQTLRAAIEDKAAELVLAWPQWARILQAVREDVVVPPAQAEPDDPLARLLGFDAPGGNEVSDLPQTMAAFAADFGRTCERLRGLGQDWALDALRLWTRDRARAGGSLAQDVTGVLDDESVRRLHDAQLGGVLRAIQLLLDPQPVADGVRQLLEGDERRPADEQHSARFPVRAEQVPSWAMTPPGDEQSRHVARVLLLRSVLIDAATRAALDDLDAVQETIHERIQRTFTSRSLDLPTGTDRDRFLNVLLGESTAPGQTVADPAKELDELHRPGDHEHGAR